MKIWNVVFKRFSEIEKGFVWVSDTISADWHDTTDCGVLQFWVEVTPDEYDIIQSIPPGCWMGVEEKKDQ